MASFTRDPEVESAAVDLLGMTEREVLRTPLPQLQAMVQNYLEDETGIRPAVSTVEVLPADRKVLATSELQMLPEEKNDTTAGIRNMMANMTIKEEEEKKQKGPSSSALVPKQEISANNVLRMPVNMEEWCRSVNGLKNFHEHVSKVLTLAGEYEKSIREQKQVLAVHKSILDEDDIRHIEDSIQTDMGEMAQLINWVSTRADELSSVIKTRLEVEEKLKSVKRTGQTNDALCNKLRLKTTKMRTLHSAMAARIECLNSAVTK